MNVNFEFDQLRLKFLSKNKNIYKNINLNINLYKLNNINNIQLREGLCLLDFYSGKVSSTQAFKKSFKEINIQLYNTLQNKNQKYFLLILKIFYLPILTRRNIIIKNNIFFKQSFNYTILDINLLPFIPDIYFKWKIPINCFFNFKIKNNFQNLFILKYLGFCFDK